MFQIQRKMIKSRLKILMRLQLTNQHQLKNQMERKNLKIKKRVEVRISNLQENTIEEEIGQEVAELPPREVSIDQEAVQNAVFTFQTSLMSTVGRISRIFFEVKVSFLTLLLIKF